MTDVRRVRLPGVGVLRTFVTEDGGKVGVVEHRSGPSELLTFADATDSGGEGRVSLRLSEDEAHTLAELMGGTQITESLADLERVPGLSIDWFTVEDDCAIAGRPIGDPVELGVVGLTVVAAVREGTAHPAPHADFVALPGDTLVVAGAPEKVARIFAYFRTGTVPRPAGEVR